MRIFHVILSLSKTLKNKKLSSLTNTKLGGLFLNAQIKAETEMKDQK